MSETPPTNNHKKIYQVVGALFIIVIILGAGYYFYSKNRSIGKEDMRIATDPSFKEIKNKYLSGFPEDFPIYAGLTLIGSSEVNTPGQPLQGYRVMWEAESGQVVKIIPWYISELRKNGWTTEDQDDPESEGEQVIKISKDNLSGYIAAEHEKGKIEIVVDLRIK